MTERLGTDEFIVQPTLLSFIYVRVAFIDMDLLGSAQPREASCHKPLMEI